MRTPSQDILDQVLEHCITKKFGLVYYAFLRHHKTLQELFGIEAHLLYASLESYHLENPTNPNFLPYQAEDLTLCHLGILAQKFPDSFSNHQIRTLLTRNAYNLQTADYYILTQNDLNEIEQHLELEYRSSPASQGA